MCVCVRERERERNLCASQEATVRIRHGTIDFFKIGKKRISRLYSFTLLI